MKKFLALALLSITLGMFSIIPVFAQVDTTNQPPTQDTTNSTPTQDTTNTRPNPSNIIKLDNPLKGGGDLFSFIELIIKSVIIPVGTIVAVLYIMYSGFQLVTAQGNTTKIEQARKGFFYAVIGTVILLGAWAITEGVIATINQIVK